MNKQSDNLNSWAGNERFHVSDLTHKAEYLETASAKYIDINICTILLSFFSILTMLCDY